jgi:hypothetical protein
MAIKDATSLVIGNCYFLVSYFDQGMRFPDIETYVFVGSNLLEGDAGDVSYWYFQDAESYAEQGIFTQIEDKASREVMRADEEALEMFFDYDGLFDVLAEGRKR